MSDDRWGATWRLASLGMPGVYVLSLVVDPEDAAVVYAGSIGAGAFKTSQGGL